MNRTGRSEAAEIVVVGARCAGAATAMLLARQGHRVTLVDRTTFPSDTLSTHALSRGGVVQLARWGLLDAVLATGAPRITRTRFTVDGEVLERPIKEKAGVDAFVAPRRTVLDALLVDAAVAAGVTLHTGVTVTDLLRCGDRVDGVVLRDEDGRRRPLSARVVVGADGLRSRVARAVDAPFLDERSARGAVHYAYVAGLPTDTFQFFVAPQVFAGVFPTNDGEAAVWACTPAATTQLGRNRGRDFGELLGAASPNLLDAVRAGGRVSPVRGAVGLPNHVRQSWGPGWALVGDAGLHRDPITGHGITDAFRDAELLARSLHHSLTGALSEDEAGRHYQELRQALAGPIFEATVALTGFPGTDEFVALQRQATTAMEDEARFLADLPPISTALAAA